MSGYEVAAAHCNFGLRGSDSNGDEAFCKTLTDTLNIRFFSKRFDTQKIAERGGVSIQMAARDLRYAWFEELCTQEGFTYVATAHHLNDSIETFLVNFTKGCGIRGLHGIPVKNGKRVRPLLFATRKDIELFADNNQIIFREDASNEERKYVRNKIRHEVIPRLISINPEFERSAGETIARVGEAEQLFDFAIEQLKSSCYQELSSTTSRINLRLLKEFPAPTTLLFEMLRDKGLHPDQVGQILSAGTGAVFHSGHYRFLVDRESLLIELNTTGKPFEEISIEKNIEQVCLDTGIVQFSYAADIPKNFPDLNDQVFLDVSKLHFPLKIRGWRKGDTFKPLGMNGKSKKLKDFFNDLKLSLFDKERIRILTDSDDNIIWIIGLRPDERFKVLPETKKCCKLSFQKAV
jgi:tRNA(Ile)-lysidine synthase